MEERKMNPNDFLQLLGFSKKEAEEIRENYRENRKKAHEKASVKQEGFMEVYKRLDEEWLLMLNCLKSNYR